MSILWWLPFGKVPEIDSKELRKRLQAAHSPVVIDVRTTSEFEQGHIADAINVPVTSLKSRLASLDLETNQPVVTVCRSAHRSIPAVRLFKRAGMEEACQLQGGMIAWEKAGMQMVVPDQD